MEGASRDPSYSKVLLTKHNFNGQSLHKNIRGRKVSTQLVPDGRSALKTNEMSRLEEGDYMRPPESSDEEAAIATPTAGLASSSKSPMAKRKREPAKGTRFSKRKKLDNVPDLPPLDSKIDEPAQPSQKSDLQEAMLLSGSQPQRKKPGYKYRQKPKSAAGPSADTPNETRAVFDASDLPKIPPDSAINRNTVDLSKDVGDQEQEQFVKPAVDLKIAKQLEDDSLGPPSSVSTVPSNNFVLEKTPEPAELDQVPTTLSSPPMSPETLAIDVIPIELSQSEQESPTVRCPVCRKDVNRTTLSLAEKNPRLLSMRKQQEFCRLHRLNDVEFVVKQQRYPTVDWEVLELQRIPKHLDHLRQVLKGKRRSYYSDKLKEVVNRAKGNRKVIRNYISEGVLDVAKSGYYGPKGTSIMLNVVSSALSRDLNKMVKDEFVQPIGIGPYVVGVLVPELTLKLVMEDLGAEDEAQARRVLEESAEIGLLLHPDDDQIEHDALV